MENYLKNVLKKFRNTTKGSLLEKLLWKLDL